MGNIHLAHRNAVEEMMGGRNSHVEVPNVVQVDGRRFALSSVSTSNRYHCDGRNVAIFVPSRKRKATAKVLVSMAVVIVPSKSKLPGYLATEIAKDNGTFAKSRNRLWFPAIITDRF